MIQPEFMNSFSPFATRIMDLEINNHLVDLEFPSPLLCSDSQIFSPSFNLSTSFFSNNFTESQSWDNELLFELPEAEFQYDMNELEQYLCNEADGISTGSISSQKYSTADFNEASPCSVLNSSQIFMTNTSTVQENNELSLFHLLKAYAEASEGEQTTLMEVIQRCISDKASPIGETMERLAFNLFKTHEAHYSYIKQESHVNLETAKKAFYNLFPYGRFAHLAANSAILEAIPVDAMTINIVDFDIDDGVQWAPVIETLSHQKKELTLILVKWASDEYSHCNPDNTRKRLIGHARSVGAELNIQEVDIEDLVSEIKKKNKRCAENQWFAFNCMTSLPHMIKSRCTAKVHEFLRVAKDVIGNGESPKGIITFGNGDADIKSTNLSNYSTFFESQLVHYQALLKSVECTLSDQFTEAKVAIECLFLSPRISSQDWLQKWENMKEGGNIRAALALEGLQLSQNTLMEANELIRQGDKSYTLTMGNDVNEIVLKWKDTPLVKLSTWT